MRRLIIFFAAFLLPVCAPGHSALNHGASAPEVPARACEAAADYFGGTAIADREDQYGFVLERFGERPLCTRPGWPREVYRLTWLPAWHPVIVVRVERVGTVYRLQAKQSNEASGDTVLLLSDAEAHDFVNQLAAARFWSLPTLDPHAPLGMDGSQWVVEGLVGGRYHVVDRWSPDREYRDGGYRRLGEWLLARSGFVDMNLVRQY
jgi:hypothetical protein